MWTHTIFCLFFRVMFARGRHQHIKRRVYLCICCCQKEKKKRVSHVCRSVNSKSVQKQQQPQTRKKHNQMKMNGKWMRWKAFSFIASQWSNVANVCDRHMNICISLRESDCFQSVFFDSRWLDHPAADSDPIIDSVFTYSTIANN